jgi:hypothetical protein
MRLLSVLLLMELSLLTPVLGLRLGLGDDDETIFLELPDILFSEVSHLRLRVRAVALLLKLLLGCSFLGLLFWGFGVFILFLV